MFSKQLSFQVSLASTTTARGDDNETDNVHLECRNSSPKRSVYMPYRSVVEEGEMDDK